jgi:CDP-diglyceride synthetase
MLAKALLTVGVLVYSVVVPVLEINATHVFNPEWPPHARLHEVWQLATNSMLGVLALWLTWRKHQVQMPALLAVLVMGGFLFAWLAGDLYGGSMALGADAPERTLLGINIGVIGALLVLATAVAAVIVDGRRNNRDAHASG